MTTPLTLTTTRRPDGTYVLTATGEVDMSNAPALADALADAVRTGDAPVTVDVTAVEYLDSAGLAAILPHAEHIRVLAGPLLGPLFTITGLGDLTTVEGE